METHGHAHLSEPLSGDLAAGAGRPVRGSHEGEKTTTERKHKQLSQQTNDSSIGKYFQVVVLRFLSGVHVFGLPPCFVLFIGCVPCCMSSFCGESGDASVSSVWLPSCCYAHAIILGTGYKYYPSRGSFMSVAPPCVAVWALGRCPLFLLVF